MKLKLLPGLLTGFILLACAAGRAPIKPGEQVAGTFEREIRKVVSGRYLLYLPEEYANDTRKWPLLLFLHGRGESGNDLEKVKVHGPPKLIAEGKSFPFIVVSPQSPEGEWWSTDMLSGLLDEMVRKYRVDEDRIYVTGLSMGGFGTWALAQRYPHRFAAIAPICGGGNPAEACAIRHLPVWVFHGAKDPVVPLEYSENMVNALERCGGKVKFTVYPEAGHDSWTETYLQPELYEWLLQQRRSPQ